MTSMNMIRAKIDKFQRYLLSNRRPYTEMILRIWLLIFIIVLFLTTLHQQSKLVFIVIIVIIVVDIAIMLVTEYKCEFESGTNWDCVVVYSFLIARYIGIHSLSFVYLLIFMVNQEIFTNMNK